MKQQNGPPRNLSKQPTSRPNYERLPKKLREQLASLLEHEPASGGGLEVDQIHLGDARSLLGMIAPSTIALSVWSPPYYVGKDYESGLDFEAWQELLATVVALHFPVIKPGGFLAVNTADILCFRDPAMPKIQAETVDKRRSPVNREDILRAMHEHPAYNRYQLAELFGCSEQTIDRRLNGNNIRGGKYAAQTRVKIVGGMFEKWALDAGFYPYDRRIWVKDPCWETNRWNTLSYRSVDEFEYIYFFWKPGLLKVDRNRLSGAEWRDWGSRGVWSFPSVRTNDRHEAMFPVELPRRVIRLLTDPGEIVLDCFMGSGSTAIAAIDENRRFIGIEREPGYVGLARERIAKIQRRPRVSRR